MSKESSNISGDDGPGLAARGSLSGDLSTDRPTIEVQSSLQAKLLAVLESFEKRTRLAQTGTANLSDRIEKQLDPFADSALNSSASDSELGSLLNSILPAFLSSSQTQFVIGVLSYGGLQGVKRTVSYLNNGLGNQSPLNRRSVLQLAAVFEREWKSVAAADAGQVRVEMPIVANDLNRSRLSSEVLEILGQSNLRSTLVATVASAECSLIVLLGASTRNIRWRKEEILQLRERMYEFGIELQQVAQPAKPERSQHQTSKAHADLSIQAGLAEHRYQQLLMHGRIIVIRADAAFREVDVVGNTEELLGVTPQELSSDRSLWRRIASPRELRRIAHRLSQELPASIDQALPRSLSGVVEHELAIVHQTSGERRWLMVRAIALSSPDGTFTGWQGYGVDITAHRRAQDLQMAQSKRLSALYAVSAAVNLRADPTLVGHKCLTALMAATNSDCGLISLFRGERGESGRIEIVASEGLSRDYLVGLSAKLAGETLLKAVIESRKGIVVSNLQLDPRAARDIATTEGLRATVIVPLLNDSQVVGALALFSRRTAVYQDEDLDVVQAAARQIAVQIRQAEFVLAERAQAHTVNLLYRLSHQLSQFSTTKEVVEHAISIMKEEFALKRIWCGLISDHGAHLLGQAGAGPGVRGSLINLRIALHQRSDALSRILDNRGPSVFNVPVADGEDGVAAAGACPGIERLLRKLQVPQVVLVPLTALGQVIGLFVLEGIGGDLITSQRQLATLKNIGSEVGSIIMARRFESKLAEAEKMRMAGLLASGVAHNFNNLLQAIMGQASLIEMQTPANSPLVSSARMILDATNRGAALIRQLMSFTTVPPAASSGDSCDIKQLLTDARDLYSSILGANIKLDLELGSGDYLAVGTAAQLQQGITNLLINAREALAKALDPQVTIRLSHTSIHSQKVAPELPVGDYVSVEIEDNGEGMSPIQLARCFEPFYTTKNIDPRTGVGLSGAGLGLSSVYTTIRSLGGTVLVQSSAGEGATFTILLPVYLLAESGDNQSASSLRVEAFAFAQDSLGQGQSVGDLQSEKLAENSGTVSDEQKKERL